MSDATEDTSPADDDEVSGSEERKPRRVLTDAEFAEIREHYELGTMGITDLGQKYNVSRQTLTTRFKAAGVVRASRAHEVANAVKNGVANAAAQSAQAAAERFVDKRADWIEETRVSGYKALKQAEMLIRKQVADGIKAGSALAAIDDNVKAARRYNLSLIENLRFRLELLKADDHVDEDDLPSLEISDLTDEDILRHHKNIDAVDEDADVDALLDTVGAGDADLELDVE